MASHNELGKEGERLALLHLQNKGYKILEHNYRYLKAEVDIMALKDGILAVVEVKTRSTRDFGLPQDFVSKKQIKRLVMATDYYVIDKDLNVEVRFDIIAVVLDKNKVELEHLKDAFYHF